MFSKVYSAAICGVDAVSVCVEADISYGLPGMTMVGFLTAQVREAQDRVRTALRNAGITIPPRKITVNLSPADIRKEGSRFDLPIAAALLAAAEIIPAERLRDTMIAGELSLNGAVLPVTGMLATALCAKKEGLSRMILPVENAAEASAAGEIELIGVHSLEDLLAYLADGVIPERPETPSLHRRKEYSVDFSEIRGQETVKRAALIAAAGFHNFLMVGTPGAGKTMIAKRIPTIMPPLTKEEQLEVARIHSIAGRFHTDGTVITERPFRSPHHTISPQALAGGGAHPVPGEITLAHRGVLFLDEMPEFSRQSLEILRQPLEDREIVIARTAGTFHFPADFLLVAAMNPCPCGYYPDRNRCMCSPTAVSRYRQKISRPLLDRIDLSTQVQRVTYDMLTGAPESEDDSGKMREHVIEAVKIQKERFDGTACTFNSEIPSSDIPKYCPMTPDAEALLKRAYLGMEMTARSYHRIIRVARTCADLDGEEMIRKKHIEEAVFYRVAEEHR
ncbi:MAG: ATP-binding protein [Lachnospiraceae bacterium]|nr:ATP-binding protein [Lachnospiraceae bacterium]